MSGPYRRGYSIWVVHNKLLAFILACTTPNKPTIKYDGQVGKTYHISQAMQFEWYMAGL